MVQPDHRDREIEVLQERLSRMSEASLSISESLDFDTVLQKVLDSARDLTGARYGVIATMDEQGGLEAILTSGTSEEEHRQLISLPGGTEIFAHFIAIAEPLRLDNYGEYAASVGLDGFLPMPVWAGLSATIKHRGQSVGFICLGHDREDKKFSNEDEETLVMFSSQAAMVIANARRYRDERRARDDLETLVNTSPVGVVVLDAATGVPKSLNREALRMVDRLRDPDQSPGDLLEVVTFRRADGREISLSEFPLAELLRVPETVRAEEIVISVPDGRSVTVLVNATPILSEAGEPETFVITLQDMTPLEEMERLRAEFLAMVSHELSTPLAAVKGSITTLLETASDLDPAEMTQFFRIIRDQSDQMRYLISDLLDVARIDSGTLTVTPEPSDLHMLVDDARRRFVGGGGRDNLDIALAPDLPLVVADKRRIVQVLSNLLSNAAGYSPEGSPVIVTAVREGVHVAVSVIDRGHGIPADRLPQLFRKFSRAHSGDAGSDVEGSGLGLAICKGIVEAHGGRIWAESDGPGLGSRFTFTLPTVEDLATAALAPAPTRSRRGGKGRVRILAVDDDPQALRYIRGVLTKAGYTPVVTGDPTDVPRLMEEEKPHLVLLDLMLPETDGVEVMNHIHRTADVPVIFLSVYGQDEVIARAFDMGATDYVVKPFSPTELSARIRAALRKRMGPDWGDPSASYAAAGLRIDYAVREVTVAGEPVDLTPTEYAVLYQLAVHAPRVMNHSMLLQRVWGPERVGEAWLLRDVVKRLRRKLGDSAADPKHIVTEPRMGYRMVNVSGDGVG